MAPKKLCDNVQAAETKRKVATPQKKRIALCDKGQAEEPQHKKTCSAAVSVQERSNENQAVQASGQKHPAENSLVARGSGRGLKAIQNSKDQTTMREGADGSRSESRSSLKEQKLYKAKTNEHIETKVMTENKKKTTRKDGTVVITETKNSRKVSYL
eukprot:TRINITY_DN72161_c0_g1_i1.p1 TRINITY_DN72161_c0_g1~~TRINITY_DN72161_c0_g1_i1.p1  ORF type:complete len:157 (-),score=32.33 TRINITY_DN72161_c0_g1_i1:184-654(-)